MVRQALVEAERGVRADGDGAHSWRGRAATQIYNLLIRKLERDNTLQSQFDGLRAEMEQLNRPVLVFVDDVDRLQPDELLALLKAL